MTAVATEHPAIARAGVARSLGNWLDAERAAAQPFHWGSNNCCHFAARWVAHATGRHVLYPGAASVSGPLAVRKRVPLGLRHHVGALLGCEGQPAPLAQVGDLLLLPQDGPGAGALLGVCGGSVAWLMAGDGGVRPVDVALAAWCWPLWLRAAAAAPELAA